MAAQTAAFCVVNGQGTHKTVYKKSLSETGVAKDITRSIASRREPECVGARTTPVLPHEDFFAQARKMVPGMLTGATSAAVARQQLASFIFTTSHMVGRSETYLRNAWQRCLSIFIDSPMNMLSGTLACYLAYIGRKDGRSYFVSASRQLYAKGLAEVQRAINCAATAMRDETLAACFALGMYEAIERPDESARAYQNHNGGYAIRDWWNCEALVPIRQALVTSSSCSSACQV